MLPRRGMGYPLPMGYPLMWAAVAAARGALAQGMNDPADEEDSMSGPMIALIIMGVAVIAPLPAIAVAQADRQPDSAAGFSQLVGYLLWGRAKEYSLAKALREDHEIQARLTATHHALPTWYAPCSPAARRAGPV